MTTGKEGEKPPAIYNEGVRIRGYYDLSTESNKVIWHPVGDAWNENEIIEFRELSNQSYKLYARVPVHPENVFFFGAGASFGSDGRHLYNEGHLPPLGKDLYPQLRDHPELEQWRNIPFEIQEIFMTRTFEDGMDALSKDAEASRKTLQRDLELSLFFSKYIPRSSNLYRKLAGKITRKLKSGGWPGAAITLNYERLLEGAFLYNSVFTPVKGVTFYDISDDDPLFLSQAEQLFEICYPHGACQFFLAQNRFSGDGDFEVREISGHTGANHLLGFEHIQTACKNRQFPLFSRYHPDKIPTVKNYFINTQRKRSEKLILNAKLITIIGVTCLPNDNHIWDPLSATKTFIVYVEPGEWGQKEFRDWAVRCGKVEDKDFTIIPHTFKGAFEDILRLNNLY